MDREDSRFEAAVSRFDAAHREDPGRETLDGVVLPRALAYAERMSRWIDSLAPGASEALRLAARCQHLSRWRMPRAGFPAGRRGYLAWRNACKRAHADEAGEVLSAVGYPEELVQRVQDLVQKRRLKVDPEAQRLEDAACLVFLESELESFSRKHGEEKIVTILRKTWIKMSPQGHAAALALDLPEEIRSLVAKAVG